MKKFIIFACVLTMMIFVPKNVRAEDTNNQEEMDVEYVEISNGVEPFSVGHKISISIHPNTEKRIGSYKLEGNKYVRLKLVYSLTSKIKVGIIDKNRSRVVLKEVRSDVVQKIKLPKTDTYWVFIQNNSNKKLTVHGVIIV